MKILKCILSFLFSKNKSYEEVNDYIELEMRKVSNLEEKNFTEKLLKRVNS